MELDIVFVIAALVRLRRMNPQSLSLFCHSDLFGIFLWDSRLNKKDSRQAGMTKWEKWLNKKDSRLIPDKAGTRDGMTKWEK